MILQFTTLFTKKTICYTYHEMIGSKGSNEVARFVYDFIQKHYTHGYRKFINYSVNCSGQKRNRFVFAMHVVLGKEFNDIEVIHRFLEVGHTQCEGDHAHSTIEQKSRKQEVFIPQEWNSIIKIANSQNPYEVIEVNQSMIYNWKELVDDKCWEKIAKDKKYPGLESEKFESMEKVGVYYFIKRIIEITTQS